MFYVGQKVVCVDDSGTEAENFHVKPVRGCVYEITGLPCVFGDTWINFDPRHRMAGWASWRFRPVTDISALQAIVAEVKTGKPRKIKADRFDKVRV